MLKSPLNSVPKLLTGKGPPINYVVSKLAIFDPLLPSYSSFYQVELAIFDPHPGPFPLSPCDDIVYGWPLNVKIQYWILCTNQSFLFYALVIKRSFFSACGCTAEKGERIENNWFSNSFRLFMLGWPKDPSFQRMVVQQKKMPGDLVHQKIQDAIFRSASAPKSRIDIFLLIHKIYSAESRHIRFWIFLTGQNFNSFV